MQFYARKILGQFASEKLGQFDWILQAMSVAYSWMPTMLDVYAINETEFLPLLKIIKGLGKIETVQDFEKKHKKIQEWLLLLTPIINNSIVGTSKVLHIFYPKTIPIIDSNVLKGWNKSLMKFYKKYPELRLPTSVPSTNERRVKVFMKYWRLLLIFKQNTQNSSIRVLEEPFYWNGLN